MSARQRIRALERLFACQRAQVILAPLADQFVGEWRRAVDNGESPPDILELVLAAAAKGLAIPYAPPLFGYVSQCRRAHRVPSSPRIVHSFVHGMGERRNPFTSQSCKCIAHADLRPPREDPDAFL